MEKKNGNKNTVETWDELKKQAETDMDLRINLFKEIEKDGTLAVANKYNVTRKRVSCWYGGNKNKIQAEINNRLAVNAATESSDDVTEQSGDVTNVVSTNWDDVLLCIQTEETSGKYDTLFTLMDEIDELGIEVVAEKYSTTVETVHQYMLNNKQLLTPLIPFRDKSNESDTSKSSDNSSIQTIKDCLDEGCGTPETPWDDILMKAALDATTYFNLINSISSDDGIALVAKEYGVSKNTISVWGSFNNDDINSDDFIDRVSAIYAVGGIFGGDAEIPYPVGCVVDVLNNWNSGCYKLYCALRNREYGIPTDVLFVLLVRKISSICKLPKITDNMFESSDKNDVYGFNDVVSEIINDMMHDHESLHERFSNRSLNLTSDIINYIINYMPRNIPYKKLSVNYHIVHGLASFIECVNNNIITVNDSLVLNASLSHCNNTNHIDPILMASALGRMIQFLRVEKSEEIAMVFDHQWFNCCDIKALPYITAIVAYYSNTEYRIPTLWAAVKTINCGTLGSERYVDTLISFSHFVINSLVLNTVTSKEICASFNELVFSGWTDFKELLSDGDILYSSAEYSFSYIVNSKRFRDYVSGILISQYCRYLTATSMSSVCPTAIFKTESTRVFNDVLNDFDIGYVGLATHIVWTTILKALCLTPSLTPAWVRCDLGELIFCANSSDIKMFGDDKWSSTGTIVFDVKRIKSLIKMVSLIKNVDMAVVLLNIGADGKLNINVWKFIEDVLLVRKDVCMQKMLSVLLLETNTSDTCVYNTAITQNLTFGKHRIKFVRRLSELPYHIARQWVSHLYTMLSRIVLNNSLRTSTSPSDSINKRVISLMREINSLSHDELMCVNRSVKLIRRNIGHDGGLSMDAVKYATSTYNTSPRTINSRR